MGGTSPGGAGTPITAEKGDEKRETTLLHDGAKEQARLARIMTNRRVLPSCSPRFLRAVVRASFGPVPERSTSSVAGQGEVTQPRGK